MKVEYFQAENKNLNPISQYYSSMPEGCVTLRSADKITRRLKTADNWLYFVDIYKIGDRFDEVDISQCIPALNQRVLNFFCKGKEYFFFLANNVGLRCKY